MSAVFVTATGTDLGKTVVTAALIRAAQRRELAADALKPVVSGFDEAAPEGSDPARLLQALDLAVTAEALDRISPWRYRAPLAANMAARLEGRSVPYADVVGLGRARIAAHKAGLLLIEGAGGVMSPLTDQEINLDLIEALAVPAVLVSGGYLGAISHALTALEVLRARRIKVAALVVSEAAEMAIPLPDTLAELARFAPGPPLVPMPRMADPERMWDAGPLLDLVISRQAPPHPQGAPPRP